MGFESTRFESCVDEELICLICNGVFEEPVWIPACQHTFCQACISEWLLHQNICPVDRNPLSSEELEKAPRILHILLSRMRIRCDNMTHGCQVVVNLDTLLAHLTSCQYNPKRPVECGEGCGLIIPFDELKSHHCIRDLRLKVEDQQFTIEIMRSEIDDHKTKIAGISDEFYQLKIKLKMFDTESLLAQLTSLQAADQTRGVDHVPRPTMIETSEDRFRSWVKCLPLARVNRWGGMISTPDSFLRTLLQRSLLEAGCPDDHVTSLMDKCHEKGWPSGLSCLETRQTNHRLFDQFVCKRIPGKQVVLVVKNENLHMGEDLILEPGIIVLFAHGVETVL